MAIAVPVELSRKLTSRLRKCEKSLLVAVGSSLGQAQSAAKKMEALMSKRPECIPHISPQTLQALNSIKKEVLAKQSQEAMSIESQHNGTTVLMEENKAEEFLPFAHDITSNVSSEVITLADILKRKTPMTTTKQPSICKMEESIEEKQRRLARASRFEEEANQVDNGPKALLQASNKRQKHDDEQQTPILTSKKKKKKKSRNLLQNEKNNISSSSSSSLNDEVDDETQWSKQAIVGTCMNLEKPYLRLTSAPNPNEVRPEFVLAQSLDHIKKVWRNKEDKEESDRKLAWATEQFKSLRQDLRVQHIDSPLTISVYETHARIALECGDLAEYNQCAGRLSDLYNTPLGLKVGKIDEFTAYRILHSLIHYDNPALLLALSRDYSTTTTKISPSSFFETLHKQDDLTSTSLESSQKKQKKKQDKNYTTSIERVSKQILARLSPLNMLNYRMSETWGPLTKHAFGVSLALRNHRYHTFFTLYEQAPMMSGYLMDFLIERVRKRAYDIILKAYSPSVTMSFIAKELSFQQDDDDECLEFLKSQGSCFIPSEAGQPLSIDTKKSRAY